MTLCNDCKKRKVCFSKTHGSQPKRGYCLNCGCLEDCCHCKDPEIEYSRGPIEKTKQKFLGKIDDCGTCRYQHRCAVAKRDNRDINSKLKIKDDRICHWCGCLASEVCHCVRPSPLHYDKR